MSIETRFNNHINRKRIEYLCNQLITGTRGKMLGREILQQLDQGCLSLSTYKRLSRWVNPRKEERFAQPIAAQISFELFAEQIGRQD